jgi:hypothetical protein
MQKIIEQGIKHGLIKLSDDGEAHNSRPSE